MRKRYNLSYANMEASHASTPENVPLNDASLILDLIPDAYALLDTEFRFTYVNRAAEKLLGQSREEMAGRTPWQAHPDCNQTSLEVELRRAMAGTASRSFENYYEPGRKWYGITTVPAAGGLL